MERKVRLDERREEPRASSLYRPALIQAGDFSGFCMIKDISSVGARVEAFATIASGQDITIQFNDDLRAEGTVIWAEGTQIGISFAQEIDKDRVLIGSREHNDGPPSRPLRLDIECEGTLKCRNQEIPALIRDISQSGFKAAASSLSVGDTVVVNLPSLAAKRAAVRWTKFGIAGLNFDVPLRYDELADWAMSVQKPTIV